MPDAVGEFTGVGNNFRGTFNVGGLQAQLFGKFDKYLPTFFVHNAIITYNSLRDFSGRYLIEPPPPPSFVGEETVDIWFTNLETGTKLHLTGNVVPPLDRRYLVVGDGLWVVRGDD
ncbi:hypothetical protein AX14_010181 [Amanita brunnescens Koide BX004]|nr:hypothetical protein AX14_010181 [Amanita brunnescens Koide BX004]